MRTVGTSPWVGVVFSLALVAGSSLAPGVAHAADPRAEELYRVGQKAAAAQSWTTACPAFRESEAREHAPGTVLNLAVCEEKLGQLVLAKEHFAVAAREFRRGDPRIAYATQRAAALDQRIPRLTLRLHEPLPADATVERDGERLDLAALGLAMGAETPARALSLDPGGHVLIVRAAGHDDARTEVKLEEGARREVTLAVGALSAAAPTAPPIAGVVAAPLPAAAAPATSPPSSAVPLDASATPESSSSSLRTAGIVATTVGGAGLVFGLIAGAVTLSKKSTADDNCPAAGCNPAGVTAESSGKTWSAASTVGVIAGAAVLATGITLIVVAPAHHADTSSASGLRITRVGLVPSFAATGAGARVGLAGSF